MRGFFTAAILALALLVVFGVYSAYNAYSHRDQAETFLRLLGENKVRQAYASADPRFQEDFDWEHFRFFVDQFQLTNYQPGSLKVSSGLTEYTRKAGLVIVLEADAALRDASTFHTSIKLRRDGGQWRVNYFYVSSLRRRVQPAPPAPTPSPNGTDTALNPESAALIHRT